MIAFAAFVSVFYFLTLYMQDVVGFSPIRSGSAYLPVTAGIVVAAGISSRLFARIGTRPVIVAGALIAAAGVWYLSRIPVRGTYPTSLLPGLVIMAIGIGAVLVSVTTAANAGVAEDKAGLAAGPRSGSRAGTGRVTHARATEQESHSHALTRSPGAPGDHDHAQRLDRSVRRHQGSCGRGDQSAARGGPASSRSPLVSTGKEI
jgi:hypothetical protein